MARWPGSNKIGTAARKYTGNARKFLRVQGFSDSGAARRLSLGCRRWRRRERQRCWGGQRSLPEGSPTGRRGCRLRQPLAQVHFVQQCAPLLPEPCNLQIDCRDLLLERQRGRCCRWCCCGRGCSVHLGFICKEKRKKFCGVIAVH